MLYLDTESCGLTGPVVLIQYAYDDGPVKLHHVFHAPVKETLYLLEELCEHIVVGFNLSHDWFAINKLYNLLYLSANKEGRPIPEELAENSSSSRRADACLKPRGAFDLYLHARKGPWQTLMDRDDICIQRVPTVLAKPLALILNKKIRLPDIYFYRTKDILKRGLWQVEVIDDDPLFANVVLRFKPSSALKALAGEIFKTVFTTYPLPDYLYPREDLYNPYTTYWKSVINEVIQYWKTNKTALSYAEQDVVLLQRLYHHWGDPPINDVDSLLACCVGACRWKGYSLDIPAVENRYAEQYKIVRESPININAPRDVLRYIHEKATITEKVFICNTKKETLEAAEKAFAGSACEERIRTIQRIRKAKKELDILFKLLETKRFCPEFKVIGTRSGRMSGGFEFEHYKGSTSINPQGIQRSLEFRKLFTFSDPGYTFSGGDFKAFEVTIADATYKDPELHADLLQGKTFHGLFGESLFDINHDEILKTKGTIEDLYDKAKRSAFGFMYGAQEQKISKVAGTTIPKTKVALDTFLSRYPNIAIERAKIASMFCSMVQPKGLGTQVIWNNPADYVESLFGYRRYFTLENTICRVLYELACYPPQDLEAEGKLMRRSREQTPRGALQSALYSCAFQIQAANMRAAANHVIQSTGAEITKKLQSNLWTLQPQGIHSWTSQPMNMHDEVLIVNDIPHTVKEVVYGTLMDYKSSIPLIAIDWKFNMKNWSEK